MAPPRYYRNADGEDEMRHRVRMEWKLLDRLHHTNIVQPLKIYERDARVSQSTPNLARF